MSADLLEFQMKALGLKPEKEFRFHVERRWRSDFAFPEQMILVEYEGGAYSGGRHTRGKGFENDCEKYNAAGELGYRVFRFTNKHVKNGTAVKLIEDILSQIPI